MTSRREKTNRRERDEPSQWRHLPYVASQRGGPTRPITAPPPTSRQALMANDHSNVALACRRFSPSALGRLSIRPTRCTIKIRACNHSAGVYARRQLDDDVAIGLRHARQHLRRAILEAADLAIDTEREPQKMLEADLARDAGRSGSCSDACIARGQPRPGRRARAAGVEARTA